MSGCEIAAYHILERDRTALNTVSLAYLKKELGNDHELYDELDEEINQYIENTPENLRWNNFTELEFEEVFSALYDHTEQIKRTEKEVFGSEDSEELVEEIRRALVYSHRDLLN